MGNSFTGIKGIKESNGISSVVLLQYIYVVASIIAISWLVKTFELLAPVAILSIAFGAVYILKIVQNIRWGFYLLMAANFLSVGLTRYIDLPLGLFIDIILIAIFFIYFLKQFKDISFSQLKNPVFILVVTWMGFNFLQIVNPEARSFEAWFYAMRGVALYFILTLLVGYLCINHKSDFNWFITMWFLFSIAGALWGIKQLYIGLDEGEKAWLSVPGNSTTHLLFGRLRVFSFYSDAGQFGASQAHTALVATILSISEKGTLKRIFFIVTALLCFYGMLISGTRGAFAIPVIGTFTYLLLIRKFKVIAAGTIIMAVIIFILKFTFIGQGNYQIQRLRSSLNPQDASFQVRLDNQKRLATYLNTHLLGGGVGSGGYWGQRFSPGTFLANLALDSWYVRIAAEYGYIGLVFYLTMMIVIVIYSLKQIKSGEEEDIRNQKIALLCGICGVLVASYANQVFGQMPTGVLMYLSIVFLTEKSSSINSVK